jgi:nucleotide-binding universal stress UspA family protein
MTRERMIVVGVDGSEGGRRALEWAVREAADRGGTVQAVAAWRWDVPGGGLGVTSAGTGVQGGEAGGLQEGRRLAEEVLEREVTAVPPSVPVARQVREGRPAEVLGDAARTADLLVVGSHGHSRVWRTVLGSVAEECVRLSMCPVVVVPAPHEARRPAAPPAVAGRR